MAPVLRHADDRPAPSRSQFERPLGACGVVEFTLGVVQHDGQEDSFDKMEDYSRSLLEAKEAVTG